MRILITGASGLLGINLAMEASKKHEVYGIVNSQPLKNPPFNCIVADLLAEDAYKEIFDRVRPDWVIHCAALASLEECDQDPAFAELMNTILPGEIASVTRGRARMLHISTDAVFDGNLGNYTEDDEPNPVTVYGKTKLNGEWAAIEADPDVLITRVNLFGWSLKGKRSLAEWFFYNLQAGKPVKGFTDVNFCPILANDLSGILIEMLKNKLSGVYHVVGSETVSKYQFGKTLAETCQLDGNLLSPVSVNDFGLKVVRGNNLSLNIGKLTADLHKVVPGFSTGLKQFATLYQQGYPQDLRKMVDNSVRDINPYRNGG